MISIGGCVYHLRVRSEHAGAVAWLSAQLALRSIQTGRPHHVLGPLGGFDYMHTSNLPQGRAQWLRRQVKDVDATMAISMDADTWFRNAVEMADALDWLRMRRDHGDDWAIALAPVRQGGTDRCNLRWPGNVIERSTPDDDEHGSMRALVGCGGPIEWHNLGSVDELGAGGFGLAVFNLPWFRQHWMEPAPEHAAINTGEDIEFCLSVRLRGGRIIKLPVGTQHAEFIP